MLSFRHIKQTSKNVVDTTFKDLNHWLFKVTIVTVAWLNFDHTQSKIKKWLEKITCPKRDFCLKKQLKKFSCTSWSLFLSKINKKNLRADNNRQYQNGQNTNQNQMRNTYLFYIVFQVFKVIKNCKIQPPDLLFIFGLLGFTSAGIIFHKFLELHLKISEKIFFSKTFLFNGFAQTPNFNFFFTIYPDLWGRVIFGPKMGQFAQTKTFWKTCW